MPRPAHLVAPPSALRLRRAPLHLERHVFLPLCVCERMSLEGWDVHGEIDKIHLPRVRRHLPLQAGQSRRVQPQIARGLLQPARRREVLPDLLQPPFGQRRVVVVPSSRGAWRAALVLRWRQER